MRLGLDRKSAGRGRDRAAKIPHPCIGGGSRLDLPSRRVKWSKSTKTLPRTSSVLNFPTMALGCPSMFGTLIDKSRREKQGVEPSYSTIRIPQTFPFRGFRPIFGGTSMSGG